MKAIATRPTLVIFDMAGTTVRDDGGAVGRCLIDALSAHGYAVTPAAANAVMGIAKPVALDGLLKAYISDPEERAERVLDIHDDFLERMLAHYRTDPSVGAILGAEETFAALRAAGIRVALDTGFNREIVDVVLDRLNWRDKVDATVASDEVEQGRPHPDMVFALMHKLGISDPSLVAKVGDTPVDLQEGTAAECGWVIGVTEGTHSEAQLQAFPNTALVPNVTALRELWGI